ncbi:EthD family reductase [Streptomyces sp. HPF1205]|uniref:EthD family reductase n=1 Tax=Streptomyces sp. HPF1205 TaxID=2873262 RepID=UPI001CED7609|nr:EthD family reductase [Streptomyces sp. HPF1205]
MTARFVALYGTPTDPERFERHYREVHIPLARRLPGLRRYTLGRDLAATGGDRPYYMVAELDWDTMDELRAAFDSPEGRACGADAGHLRELAPLHTMIFTVDDGVR